MSQVRNHYDNLKVARNAPLEVIEAAYRALVRKYHPDRNSSPSANRVMRIITAAYDVLSDPARRRQHDDWIERTAADTKSVASWRGRLQLGARAKRCVTALAASSRSIGATAVRYRVCLALVAVIVAVTFGNFSLKEAPMSAATPPRTAAMEQVHLDPWPPIVLAPTEPPQPIAEPTVITIQPHVRAKRPRDTVKCLLNTMSWPPVSGYFPGAESPPDSGLSTVIIDNNLGTNDAFVKLVVDPNTPEFRSVAWIFVKAHDQFKTAGLRPGSYAVYFQDVATCAASKSAPFQVSERHSYNEIDYADHQVTLYTRNDGNLRLSSINQDEFDSLNANPNP